MVKYIKKNNGHLSSRIYLNRVIQRSSEMKKNKQKATKQKQQANKNSLNSKGLRHQDKSYQFRQKKITNYF